MPDGTVTETITFTLDGAEVTVPAGLTIWEAANGRGLVIPHLCHKPAPGYRPDGNCRACVVEIEGERVLAASCIRTPTPGMVVNTATGRARAARKGVIEMLVADQPVRADAHDRSAHFWDMADQVGRRRKPLPQARAEP
jgi:formate dehydrogenase major subunit